MNNVEIRAIKAKALFKSRVIAAIWASMSALTLLYTITWFLPFRVKVRNWAYR